MLDPKSVRLEVALAHIREKPSFFRTLGYWQERAPEPTDHWLRALPPLSDPLTVADGGRVVEMADCRAEVVAPDNTAVHVYGDLDARIILAGTCEVVVAGDVLPGGSIHGDEHIEVYVAGSLRGKVASRSFLRVWVGGDLTGRVRTGEPYTHVCVRGDCTGTFCPLRRAALLYLEVNGFMPFDLIERTAVAEYTEFLAAVHRSDRPAGFYPDRVTRKRLAAGRSYNRWVILTDG